MFAKRFFYVSAAILCLAAAYHLGATTAKAAPQTNPVVGVGGGGGDNRQVFVAVTANGDAFMLNPNNTWFPLARIPTTP